MKVFGNVLGAPRLEVSLAFFVTFGCTFRERLAFSFRDIRIDDPLDELMPVYRLIFFKPALGFINLGL